METTVSRPARRPGRGTSRRGRRLILAYCLVAPALLWRCAVAIYPFLHAVAQSFTNESSLNAATHWVGLRNYSTLFQDPTITDSIGFTAIFTIASTCLQIAYALAIATLLNRRFRGRGLIRAVNLLPWAMPTIVVATAAQWLFNTQYGMLDDLLARVLPLRPVWLADPTLVRAGVVLLDSWKNAPWAAIFLLAGLQDIPGGLYEAARIDGASSWRTFRSVVLPLLAPILITLTIFVATSRVLTFDLIYGLTQGGPGTSTSLLSYQVYKLAFSGLYYGYGSAVAVLSFLIVCVISVMDFMLLRHVSRGL